MKQHSLLFGIVIAIVAAVGIPVSAFGLQLVLPFSAAFKVTLVGAAALYVAALATVSERRRGKALAVLALAVGTAVTLTLNLGIPATLLWLVGVICAARILLLSGTVLNALLEVGLAALALVAAAGTLVLTRSLGLTAWSFFLVLAAGPVVTSLLGGIAGFGRRREESLPRFERAFRAAEGSLAAMVRR